MSEPCKPGQGFSVETWHVTPKIAKEWLGMMTGNRPLRPRAVNRYAADMASGNWSLGVGSIDFDTRCNLINGQHRLHACIQSGCSFETVVHFGMPPEAYAQEDTGLGRKLSDVLHHQGERNAATLAAAIGLGWRWENGYLLTQGRSSSRAEQLDWLAKNPGVREFIIPGSNVARFASVSHAPWTTLLYRISFVEPDEVAAFGARVASDVGLPEGSPILAYHRWAKGLGRYAGGRPQPATYLAFAAKAWNAWITGVSVKQLVWRRGGRSPEAFPTLLDASGAPHPFGPEGAA